MNRGVCEGKDCEIECQGCGCRRKVRKFRDICAVVENVINKVI